jgi:hypothetical protein
MVSNKLVQELRQIMRDDCHKRLNLKEAAQAADFLVAYFSILSKIDRRIKSQGHKTEHLKTG